MTKEQLLESTLEVMKEMTPTERGELLADMLQLSLHLAMEESCSSSVREIIDKNKTSVS